MSDGLQDTLDPDSARAALVARWTHLGVRQEDLVPQPNGTIVERRRPERAAEAARAAQAEGVVLGSVLGIGGMGVVHLADQPELRREVAVKLVRPDRQEEVSISALLREAWVMGMLEHPNIPPVHLLLRDQDGLPRVVMKRIEGLSWETLIRTPDLAKTLAGDSAKDPLEFHLRVLMAVCHAVHFAHSRGILHLDLKPDNVMVGRFGEVQVVDWGIAMSYGDDGPSWLPASRSLSGVRGTPQWLSAEQAAAQAELISPRTDVYLLGSLLHAVLTGRARHVAGDMLGLLAEAYVSEPYRFYASDVPAELAELANRATARRPEDRPASAEEFRSQIEAFLAHRASVRLSEDADRRTGPLLARLHAGEGREADSPVRRELLECEFAFRQALAMWPGNPVAGARLAELGREAEQERARLKALERDADPNLHRRTRAKLALACGLTFIVWNGLAGWLHRSKILDLTLADLVWFDTATTIVFGVVAFAVRKTLLKTDFNRRVVILFGGGFAAVFVMWIGAWQLSLARPDIGLGVGDVVSLSTMIYVYFVMCLTFMMDVRILWLALPAALLAIFAPRFPEYAFESLGLGGFMIGCALAFIWWRPRALSQSTRSTRSTRSTGASDSS